MAHRVEIEDLQRLNEELLALSRAGLPLSPDLVRSADLVRSESGDLARRVGDRCAQGAPLSEAIEAEQPHLPGYYKAIVRAGESSGRMTAALESLADALTSVQRLRRVSWSACAYPIGVAIAAWLTALWGTSQLWPAYDWIGDWRGADHNAFESWRHVAFYATLIGPPLFLLGGALVLRLRQEPWSGGVLLGWSASMPAVGEAVRCEAAAAFCRLLGLQLANGAALHDALPLAAEATGWPPYEASARTLARVVRSGGTIDDVPEARDTLPPFAIPALGSGSGAAFVSTTLLGAAEHYRDRARLGLETAEKLAPLIAVVFLGGGALIGYAAVMLGPYLATLWTLAAHQ